MLYFYHTPKLGPARAMLIERLCYYRGCYDRGSTVIDVNSKALYFISSNSYLSESREYKDIGKEGIPQYYMAP